jgi:hypothetical protein
MMVSELDGCRILLVRFYTCSSSKCAYGYVRGPTIFPSESHNGCSKADVSPFGQDFHQVARTMIGL